MRAPLLPDRQKRDRRTTGVEPNARTRRVDSKRSNPGSVGPPGSPSINAKSRRGTGPGFRWRCIEAMRGAPARSSGNPADCRPARPPPLRREGGGEHGRRAMTPGTGPGVTEMGRWVRTPSGLACRPSPTVIAAGRPFRHDRARPGHPRPPGGHRAGGGTGWSSRCVGWVPRRVEPVRRGAVPTPGVGEEHAGSGCCRPERCRRSCAPGTDADAPAAGTRVRSRDSCGFSASSSRTRTMPW